MDIYNLTRNYWNFAFDNPDIIKPSHAALYHFAIEHCNRLGWKEKFGLPTTMAMEALGMKSYKTYINTFNDLIEFGFFEILERSKNQYSSNVIALVNFDKAHTKALDKALLKHGSKQVQSTVSIDIHNTNKQINHITRYIASDSKELFNNQSLNGNFLEKMSQIYSCNIEVINQELDKWISLNENNNFKDLKHLQNSFNTWMRNYKPVNGNTKKIEDEPLIKKLGKTAFEL